MQRFFLPLMAGTALALLGVGYLAIRVLSSGVRPQPVAVQSFRDCVECPEMVVIAAGSYTMGSEPWPKKPSLVRDAAVQRSVTIASPFGVSKYEVTFAQWEACVAEKGCTYQPQDEGFGRDDRPVLNVSWQDAQQYIDWLSVRTGGSYRLLTEAEWEYAARAGSQTPYPWGDRASHRYANYGRSKCCTGRVWRQDRWEHTAPVGQFPPNRWDLHDTQGNVYEWVQDCYVDSYTAAPSDGSAVTTPECPHRVIRGGAWYSDPGRIRSSYRAYQTPDKRDRVIGLRVAKTL